MAGVRWMRTVRDGRGGGGVMVVVGGGDVD